MFGGRYDSSDGVVIFISFEILIADFIRFLSIDFALIFAGELVVTDIARRSSV